MKNIIIGFSAFIALIIIAYLLLGNPGKKEFQREEKALEKVSSWRINLQISQRGILAVNRIHEAVCPDREHIVERGEHMVEYIRIADDVWYKADGSAWIKGMPSPDLFAPLPSPRPCLTDPNEPKSQPPGGAEEMRLALEHDASEGTLEKGDVNQVKGTPCREWEVSMVTANNKMGSYKVCISEDTHLPLLITTHRQDLNMWFEWDVPVTV